MSSPKINFSIAIQKNWSFLELQKGRNDAKIAPGHGSLIKYSKHYSHAEIENVHHSEKNNKLWYY